jgi:ATP-dependent helicase/nuclease subunit A
MESFVPGTSSDALTPKSVADMKNHEIVRAGAGTGKTYALTHKVMDLAEAHLKEHGRLPRLIVTTFTRKATQELRERLMLLALEERPHLIDFVNSRSHLVVSTIHGVMDLYLKRYGANICIDPGYRVIGAPEASKLSRQILRQILLDESQPTDLLEAFPFNKLASLVRKIDVVLAENPAAEPFALDDFERLFRDEAKRVAKLLHEAAARIQAEATKPAWLEMAEVYLQLAALLVMGDWRDNRAQFISLRESMSTARRSPKGPQPVSEETIEFSKEARDAADEFLEPVFDPEAWTLFVDRYAVINEVAIRFSKDFRKAKLEQGLLEISDLEHLAMHCIRTHPHSSEAFCQEWDHWLIDEYQDTSPFQVELIRQLSGQSPSFVVGDPQQSIYLFRGARSEVFGQREKEILAAGGEQRQLIVNRRSCAELLLFLNDFFSRLTPPFQPMEPFLEDGQAIDPKRLVAIVFIGQEADPDRDTDGESELLDDAKNAQEMRAIVCHVQNLLTQGARPEDICVLGRTNRTLTDVAAWLSRYRLPTHIHVAAGFFDRREIRDALSLLKFLVNPHDNFNTLELLRSPWFRLPDSALAPITKKRVDSVWERLLNERSMADEFQAIGLLQELLQSSLKDGLSETFKRGLIDAGFIDLSHAHDVSGRRESNVWKLLARLQQEDCKPGFNPIGFINGAIKDINVEESNSEGDAVAAVEPDRINLMTVHASKGLEFEHVILPRMEQKPRLTVSEEFTYDENVGRWALRVPYGENHDMTKSLPEATWLKTFQAHELQEHARVLYVALTRASKSVYLSWTGGAQSKSWAEMVRLDLDPGVHETSSYTYKVESNDQRPKENDRDDTEAIAPRAHWQKPLMATGALQIFEGSQIEKPMSVSEILERKPGIVTGVGSKREVTHWLKLAHQGTAVHRLMELLKYPSQKRLSRLIAKWFPEQEERVLGAVEFVRKSAAPPLLEIIKNGEVEWGFSIIEEGLLIEGQIDLWGRTDSGEAWIIDYKTGNPELREKAFEQMSLYALAIRKSGLLQKDEPLKLAAVYPFAELVFVESEPPKERVRHMLGLN